MSHFFSSCDKSIVVYLNALLRWKTPQIHCCWQYSSFIGVNVSRHNLLSLHSINHRAWGGILETDSTFLCNMSSHLQSRWFRYQFYFWKQNQLMKRSCWHRLRSEMSLAPWLYPCFPVWQSFCLSDCPSKGSMYQIQQTIPGFLGVQIRSTTCAMTTNQPPVALDYICYIPNETEQNLVIQFVVVTRSMKHISAHISRL